LLLVIELDHRASGDAATGRHLQALERRVDARPDQAKLPAPIVRGEIMATLAQTPPAPASATGDDRFFLRAAIVMALTIAAGFSLQLAMGRSSFHSPPLVHAHAIVFMGWVTLYLLQNVFVATGNMALHRRLGWIGAGWMVAMVVLGCWVTVAMVRRGQVPFFFRPLQFLVFDPMTVFTFAGLTAAAIALRRRTDWHRRLHYCGMSLLLGPAFGRLLPMPLLQPWAFEAVFAALMIFPVVGVVSDLRRTGHAHPAWRWGIAVMVGSLLLTEAITYSPVGSALYRAVVAGSHGAAVPPLDFAAPPAGPQITGRA
jgi:hypothetical protein